MVADLHSHLPMYVGPIRAPSQGLPTHALDRLESALVAHAGRGSDNFLEDTGKPRVSVPLLRQGGVGVAFSVLYSAFEEFVPRGGGRSAATRFFQGYRAIRRLAPLAPSAGAIGSLALARVAAADPPLERAFPRLLRRLENLERYVEVHHGDIAGFARSPMHVDQLLSEGRIALIHCVEGGFHLGRDPADVEEAVRELARRGVAYITLGHLFFRGVATVAPAIPYVDKHAYDALFPQPREGLTTRARVAIRTMVEEGILLDICHLSPSALDEVFSLLDEIDPHRTVPVIASHTATRVAPHAYNLDDETIERVASRGGVIGVILAGHLLADGSPESGMELFMRHVDRIADVIGNHRHTAIGSDLGGFIDPISGVPSASALETVRNALEHRYGADDAEAISSKNVLRLLNDTWRR